ncbi:MAG: glutamine synthetase [Gemmataceae bacterium]|nr:glutamine synthetase [Gemmataceae bacterium]
MRSMLTNGKKTTRRAARASTNSSYPHAKGNTANPNRTGVCFVRFTYVCNDGVVRSKVRYVGHDGKSPAPTHIGLSAVEQLMTAIDDSVIEQPPIDATTEVRLAADWSTFRPILHCEGHGRVFGPIVDGKGDAWGLCPRTFLDNVVSRAKDAGYSFRVAFENEFYVFGGDTFAPIDRSVYSQDDAFSRAADLMAAAAKSLEAAAVLPVTLHPESGPGQFEVAITPADPLKAADDQIVVRSTLKDLAAQRGMRATFLPRPLPGRPSSGSHINLSVWKDDDNVTGDGENLSPTGGGFVAGVLAHLPGLVAVTCPSFNSYDRLRPGMWSGAVRGWGRSNREAAVRVPLCKGGAVTHIEYRCADATCNPYLALGAIVAAGMDGIEKKQPLPPEAKKHAIKVKTGEPVLPQRLDRALRCLTLDGYLRDRMGRELHACYLATRRAEFARLKAMRPNEVVRLLAERF